MIVCSSLGSSHLPISSVALVIVSNNAPTGIKRLSRAPTLSKEREDLLNVSRRLVHDSVDNNANCVLNRSIVINHLQSLVRQQENWAIVFAYCQIKDQLSISQIICSLLRQLVEDHERVSTFLYDHHFLTHIRDGTAPSDNHLISALKDSLSLFSRVFIVIDAVDELPPQTYNELLDILSSLDKSILITSRPLVSLKRLLPKSRTIEIVPSQLDLTGYVGSQIEKSPALRAIFSNRRDLREEAITMIRDTCSNL
jgi:hypothetical protein